MSDPCGQLSVVPTPIGHLKDLSYRAVEVLQKAALILAEDTRVSAKLLGHYQIETPMRSYHAHNEHQIADQIVEEIQAGHHVALISDAGTPGISDPGFLLVRRCIDAGLPVECLPGPTAFVPALVVSGLPAHRFHFEGFLPHKKGRRTRLAHLCTLADTFILYESPHRVARCLHELITHCGAGRQACVCRELTKLHEEVVRGPLSDLHRWAEAKGKIRGEIVIVVEGNRTSG